MPMGIYGRATPTLPAGMWCITPPRMRPRPRFISAAGCNRPKSRPTTSLGRPRAMNEPCQSPLQGWIGRADTARGRNAKVLCAGTFRSIYGTSSTQRLSVQFRLIIWTSNQEFRLIFAPGTDCLQGRYMTECSLWQVFVVELLIALQRGL